MPKALRFYHENKTLASWELKETVTDFPFKMGDTDMAETFKTFDPKDNIKFRTCEADAVKGDAAKPLTRLCDPIYGFSMKICEGPAGKNCAGSFKHWGKLLVTA